ncbi:MAG: D-alanyl-D-alanine carboxypeptidase family protein [Scytonema sp. PMC 1069.18]|nr:D-alanyl-D-alanine carboxypeptidase family protein [Scytonema sp. PMC 1069.18]MEC4882651.1 D-alanyl-D-alanine carboxypeptidase family protein [Scytonema sp. PMC 1070.18]
MTFTLVASRGMTRQKYLSANTLPKEDCLIARLANDYREISKHCTSFLQETTLPDLVTPSTPNLSLPEKERFLAIITYNLPVIPTPNTYQYILLQAYGAPFVNQQPEIKLPSKVIFTNEQETKQFQSNLRMGKVNGTHNCYLQKAAADALNKAKKQVHIPLKSGYGASDCTRSFATNLRFWQKYANSRTLEQVQQGKETRILGVVAPPGTSQHLWGLAIDLRVTNEKQKQALNQNGWFRTVERDIPHWTYIGLPKEKLTDFGFKNKEVAGVTYWLTPL